MAKKYITTLLLVSTLGISASSTLANNMNNAQIAVNTGNVSGSVDNLIAGYGKNWKAKYLFAETPFKKESLNLARVKTSGLLNQPDQTIYTVKAAKASDKGNKADEKESFIISPKVKDLKEEGFKDLQPAEQAIFFMLNSTNNNVSNLVDMLIIESCASDPTRGITNNNAITNRRLCDPSVKSIPNYSLNSLIGPIAYKDNTQSNFAKQFIQYASMLAIPFDMPSREDLEAAEDAGKRYLIFLRTAISAQSAGLTNLYQIYLARKPVTNLGNEAGIGKADASPLEVEQYAATRRLNPKITSDIVAFDDNGNKQRVRRNWYESMETASPAQVQREMVYLLAEMRHEMFQQRLATERLTALMSLIQIEQNRQALSTENTTLKSQVDQALYNKSSANKGAAVTETGK